MNSYATAICLPSSALRANVLKHVTSRWGVLILVALRAGTHRFSDLRRKMGGVSEKMLAQSLQALEQDGFIDRVSYPVVPPHVEYSLTPLGEQVSEKVAALADWIELNLPAFWRTTSRPLPEAESYLLRSS
ncbi:HTH-type transcriptional activator hxlR [Raoultella terrigena]|uniref:HTH-type transcriptional activator hxlR n=1 Tax=Raoultella terrigena TaxID=577 RepID=A0A3P8M501_RAOTE|nr:HTH-type transcriptional activator hxlR [Raoultella terrigena]